MFRYLAQRVVSFVPTIFGISLLVFFAIRSVPGDSITAMLGTEAGMLTESQRASLEKYFGLDKPDLEQYVIWLGHVLQGDLGYSVRQGAVLEVACRFPVTLELTLMSLSIALLIRTFGIISAMFTTRWSICWRVFALIGLAAPGF
jgi:peptide/nickel transport system permease protein